MIVFSGMPQISNPFGTAFPVRVLYAVRIRSSESSGPEITFFAFGSTR